MKVGWDEAPLHSVVTLSKKKGGLRPLPYVGLEDISSEGTGRFLGSTSPQSDKSTTFEFGPQHLLYGRLRPYLNKVLLPNFEGHCSSEIFPILPSSRLNRQFLFYWITADRTVAAINATCTGARMPRADVSELLSFRIPLPRIDEQRRIVAILDGAIEGLDRVRANAEANLQNAQNLFDGFISSAFCVQGWPIKTLNQISENLDRVRIPITKADRKGGDVPYYGASGVVDHVADFLFEEDLLLVSEDGANLLARAYPIAFSISGKSWVNNHAHVLRFPDLDTQEYVRFYLNSISLKPFVTGMAQPKLNQAQLNRIPIPFPDDNIRAEIVAKASQFASEVGSLQTNYEAALKDLADLRQSLLERAFAGELT